MRGEGLPSITKLPFELVRAADNVAAVHHEHCNHRKNQVPKEGEDGITRRLAAQPALGTARRRGKGIVDTSVIIAGSTEAAEDAR